MSSDLRTKVKVYSNYIHMKVNNSDALNINKPDAGTLEIDVLQSNSTVLRTGALTHTLSMYTAVD